MSDYKDYGSNKSSLVLEGAYKGIVAKIEDARERICRELETGTQQDLSAYESMMEGIRQGVESLLSEFRFVSQQNSAIYEYQEETRKGAQSEMMNFVNSKFDSILTSLGNVGKKKDENPDKRNDELSGEIGSRLDALLDAIKAQHDELLEAVNARVESVLEEVSSRLNDSVGSVVVSVGNRVDGVVDSVAERVNTRFESFSDEYRERLYSSKEDVIRVVRDSVADMPTPAVQQDMDYEYLADRIAARMSTAVPAPQEIDYEYLADRVAARMSSAIPAPQEIDYEYLADRIAARTAPPDGAQQPVQPVQPVVQTVQQEIDYDALAAKLSERIKIPAREERGSTPIVMFDSQPQPVSYTENERQGFSDESFDYDVLAEKIASILPETDYDMIAEKVAAIIPEVDYDAITDHVANAVPQTDYDAMADKVASCIPLTDYDLIAERVAEQIGAGGRISEDAAAEERRTTETEVLIEAITGNITDALTKQFDITVDEEGVQKLAEAVGQALDYDAFAQKVADLIRGDEADLFRIAQETKPQPIKTKAVNYADPLIEEELDD
ncbi:MAG: hypothetical protein NC131_20905, partial [Roseburia sp.]|nr:hypothetical protein [Roseburia sp.]